MSNTQYAFIERHRVPDCAALQSSIDELGFDAKLDAASEPFPASGFTAFVLNGEAGPGFEIESEAADAVLEGDAALRQIAGHRDHCLSMGWHGSMKDLACVMIVSCALVKDFGAVVSYQGEPPETLAGLLEGAREALAAAEQEGGHSDPMTEAAQRKAQRQAKSPWWKVW